jgi:hypothetical protein
MSMHSTHPDATIIDARDPENFDVNAAQQPVEYQGQIFMPCGAFFVTRHSARKLDGTLSRDVGCVLMSLPRAPIGLVVSLTPELLRATGQGLIAMADEIEADAAQLADAALNKAAGK